MMETCIETGFTPHTFNKAILKVDYSYPALTGLKLRFFTILPHRQISTTPTFNPPSTFSHPTRTPGPPPFLPSSLPPSLPVPPLYVQAGRCAGNNARGCPECQCHFCSGCGVRSCG
eukprot:377610-Rhodomonas_salina.2